MDEFFFQKVKLFLFKMQSLMTNNYDSQDTYTKAFYNTQALVILVQPYFADLMDKFTARKIEI